MSELLLLLCSNSNAGWLIKSKRHQGSTGRRPQLLLQQLGPFVVQRPANHFPSMASQVLTHTETCPRRIEPDQAHGVIASGCCLASSGQRPRGRSRPLRRPPQGRPIGFASAMTCSDQSCDQTSPRKAPRPRWRDRLRAVFFLTISALPAPRSELSPSHPPGR